jgi:excisionase family DNA binding protein
VDFLTVREVGEHLRISRTTVERLIERGHLKRVKVGRAVRIPAESVEALKASGSETAR